MKIALIQTPVWGTYDPPVALAQLCACLRKEGHEVYVFDINIELYRRRKENYKNAWAWEQSDIWYAPKNVSKFFNDNCETLEAYVNEIIDTGARLFCFSVATSSYLSSLELAKMIKGKMADGIVVFGGTLFFEKKWVEIILGNESVNLCLEGEGEITLCELARLFETDKGIDLCQGVSFKRDGQIISTKVRPNIKKLDELPFLDFASFPLDKYDDSIHIPMMASRGCIQPCVFCSSRAFWRGYRAMSGERIYREVKYQIEQNKEIDHIGFLDLLFNGNMKSLIHFCDLMIENFSKRRVFWSANVIVRPEMNSKILRKMKQAGCEHLTYGIESGSQRVLDLMRKRYKIYDADEVMKATHEAGIKITANFMFGFPWETEWDFQQTLEFLKRNSEYLDRAYPSRTYCALEEHSYLHAHPEEFDIKPNYGNHLYWETQDGKNTYPERLRRCEAFCQLAFSLGIEVGCGVQTSVELDRWYNLGHYYEWKEDYQKALNCYTKYYQLDPKNEVILNKIQLFDRGSSGSASEDASAPVIANGPEDKGGTLDSATTLKELDTNKSNAQKYKVRFTWNIHYDCNYRCSYCFFEGKWEEYKKRNVYLSVDEWMEYWHKIYERYGCSFILITGGEPFTYPNFICLLKELSELHYPINVSSNLSGDIEAFANEIDPERVSLSVSFQPEFDNLEGFLGRVVSLRKYNFKGCINFVAYPPHIKDVEDYVSQFKSIGEELKVIPFWGQYQNMKFPYSYSKEEREIIGIDDSWFNKVRKKGSLCWAGQRSALIFPDGKVARCGQIGEKMVIGNFFDDGFRLLNEPLPCAAEACPCDEDTVWPEEEPKQNITSVTEGYEESIELDVTGTRGEERIANSHLNDGEYNSKKIILESSPKTIFIQAAGPCNSNCAFCSRGSDYEFFNLTDHRSRFEEKLYPFISKAESLIFTGSGEFLALPDGCEILDFFDRRFPDVEKVFSTNGSSLTPKICEKIVASQSKYTIHVSLHASTSRLHKVLTRADTFYRIIGQIKYLKELSAKSGNLELRLIFVATTLNIEDLPNFVRMASQLGINSVICYYNYIYSPTQKYLSCYFKQETTNEIFTKAEDLAGELGLSIVLPPRFNLDEYPRVEHCSEPWSQIMFTSLGDVLPCDASEDCSENLLRKDFMEIWNGDYYRALRKSLVDRSAPCFKHCLRANPSAVNDFASHVIRRGRRNNIDILWEDNF